MRGGKIRVPPLLRRHFCSSSDGPARGHGRGAPLHESPSSSSSFKSRFGQAAEDGGFGDARQGLGRGIPLSFSPLNDDPPPPPSSPGGGRKPAAGMFKFDPPNKQEQGFSVEEIKPLPRLSGFRAMPTPPPKAPPGKGFFAFGKEGGAEDSKGAVEAGEEKEGDAVASPPKPRFRTFKVPEKALSSSDAAGEGFRPFSRFGGFPAEEKPPSPPIFQTFAVPQKPRGAGGEPSESKQAMPRMENRFVFGESKSPAEGGVGQQQFGRFSSVKPPVTPPPAPEESGLFGDSEKISGSVGEEQGPIHRTKDAYEETFRPVLQPGWQLTFGKEASKSAPPPAPPRLRADGIYVPSVEDREKKDTGLPRMTQGAAGDRAVEILMERLKSRRERFQQQEDSAYRRRDSTDAWKPPQQQTKGSRVASSAESKKQRKDRKHSTPEHDMMSDAEIERDEDTVSLDKYVYLSLHMMGSMCLDREYIMGDFTKNPDIEEKPYPSLEEHLEKHKPAFMKAGLIHSEEDWKFLIGRVVKAAPAFEEYVEEFGGPGRYTAKQENADLEEIANTLPSDVGPKLQAFSQNALTTLQSNPGLNLDEKQYLLTKVVKEFSQYQYVKQ